MIAFNTIPINVLTPGQYVEIDNSKAVQGLPVIPHRILIIAPRLASGTLPALTPSRVRSAAEGESFCGRGSIGAAMIAAAKAANPYTDMYVIGVADGGSATLASGTITIVGPATAAGTLNAYIAGTRVPVSVATADTATVVATALTAAINANTALPVTATNLAGVITLTARNGGTTGNDIDVRVNYNFGDYTPTGLTATIVAMTSGATNPDLNTVIAALGDTHYHTIITPWTDAASMTVLETLMSTRWGGMVMKEGHVFGAYAGTHSAIATLASNRNSPFVSLMSTQKSPTPTWVLAAVLGATDASQAESPTNCNRPRQTMELVGVLPPAETDRYTRTERNTHLTVGAATYLTDDGGTCRIERIVTTYKTSNGVADVSYQDVEVMRLLAYLRYSVRVRVALRFPRFKLANDGTPIPPGQPIATPKSVRDELITLFMDWQDAGLCEGLDQFKRDLMVERNASDVNRLDAIIPPDLINGFRTFAASVQFRL
jgi:phage tail sheath gpL-like